MADRVPAVINLVAPGILRAVDVLGRRVAIANVNGTFYAFEDACTHLGCSLATKGRISGTTVICDCHGSEFDVQTGTVLHGPATRPLHTYPVDAEGNVDAG